MNAPKVAGLDLSLARTGICYPDGTTSTTKVRPASMKGGPRLVQILEQLDPLFLTYPDLVVIEDYSPGSIGIAGKLANAELHGCVLHRCALNGVPVAKVRPSALKRWATGNGSADKLQMVAAALEAGWDGDTHDEADAFHLRGMGLHHLTGEGDPARQAWADSVAWPDVAGST